MPPRARNQRGFTLVELVLVMGIVGTLASLAMPRLAEAAERARVARAIADIAILQVEIAAHEPLPATLDEIGRGGLLDPWGNPYQYARLQGAKGAQPRKDKSLVPINSDFDLYSMGPDGRSVAPLTAKHSRDDIVRANDGGFVGRASDF